MLVPSTKKSVLVALVMELPEGAVKVPLVVTSETPVVVLAELLKVAGTMLMFAWLTLSAGPLIAINVGVTVFAVTRVPVPDVKKLEVVPVMESAVPLSA